MKIPASSRRRALLLVDVQKSFITKDNPEPLLNIKKLIAAVPYDLYVQVVFSAERDSLWAHQTGWSLPNGRGVQPLKEISDALQGRQVYRIQKHTKSAFHGDADLLTILKTNEIEELHIVGFDLNDCVMASAFDAFDYGFFTYVLEECSGESQGSGLRVQAIEILRYLNLTNNSIYEDVPLITPGTPTALSGNVQTC